MKHMIKALFLLIATATLADDLPVAPIAITAGGTIHLGPGQFSCKEFPLSECESCQKFIDDCYNAQPVQPILCSKSQEEFVSCLREVADISEDGEVYVPNAPPFPTPAPTPTPAPVITPRPTSIPTTTSRPRMRIGYDS